MRPADGRVDGARAHAPALGDESSTTIRMIPCAGTTWIGIPAARIRRIVSVGAARPALSAACGPVRGACRKLAVMAGGFPSAGRGRGCGVRSVVIAVVGA